MPIENILILLFSYILGSIPFGYIMVRLTTGSDIRQVGSGGTGATNVSRKAGKGAGIIVLFLDALKGVAAVMLAKHFSDSGWIIAASAFLAIVGHCFPVWLKFKAGKGVATGLGVFLALAPWCTLAAAVIFLLVVLKTRYVSLSSITAAIALPLFAIAQQYIISPMDNFLPIVISLFASSALIVFKHSDNIKRLVAGTENKFK